MRFFASKVGPAFAVVALTAVGAAVGQILPRGPVGTAAVRGRVTAAETGLPLRNVQLRLTGSGVSGAAQFAGTLTASTDDGGRYEFASLLAGRYTLTASKA